VSTTFLTSQKTKVRAAVASDIPYIVDVHMRSFKGFFLTFLGPAFLRELYTATLVEPSGVIYVAENEEGICGFVSGTSYISGFYKRLLYLRWWRFALASIASVLRRPSALPRLLRAFTMPAQTSQLDTQATLMSIAVSPELQGSGIGKQLVEVFFTEMCRLGAKAINLTTDRDNNDRANRFYQNLGFHLSKTFTTPEGRAMNEYVLTSNQ
jgi:ribosomal protein S18 acetylase RimI-like enzyme